MTCEMGPFDWGIRFEPVVKQVLERQWGVEIAESGRLLHPKDPHLAASPDGLILAATDPARVGRLIEIKCPITRSIGEGVPFEYWCQMQIQMEVTGIDECDYVEVKLESLQKHNTELRAGALPDGWFWILQIPSGTYEMKYAYTEAERDTLLGAGWELVESVPWRVAGMWTTTVVRDRNWFRGTEELRRKPGRMWRRRGRGHTRPRPQSRARAAVGRRPCLYTRRMPLRLRLVLIVDDEEPVLAPETAPC